MILEERYYVLEKFGAIHRSLVALSEAMPLKRQAIERYRERKNIEKAREVYQELETLRNKLLEHIINVRLLFMEADMPNGVAYAGKLYGAIAKFNLMAPDFTKFSTAITQLTNLIPHEETTNASVIGRLMNNVRQGYYPTDLEHIKLLKQGIVFPENKRINALDTCCGCGLALEMLTMGERTDTYGIEIDELRGQEAETHLSRVGFGSFFHSRISNEAFHLLFLNPPYLSVMTEGGSKSRSEKKFLVDSLYHLMMGGLLIYVIPYYRLTADICRILCDNFDDLKIYRFMAEEFKKFNQVAVLGIRKPKHDGSELVKTFSKYAMVPDKLPPLSNLPQGRYVLPQDEKKVELFKGAVFNLGELKRQLAASKTIGVLFEKSKLDATEKSPLLPLNVGQVGLIGGSGLINGYVQCDSPHIIKGRIIKETKKFYNDAEATLTETRVNRMIFNVLTPEGFKKLA